MSEELDINTQLKSIKGTLNDLCKLLKYKQVWSSGKDYDAVEKFITPYLKNYYVYKKNKAFPMDDKIIDPERLFIIRMGCELLLFMRVGVLAGQIHDEKEQINEWFNNN